jgi:hypothetical protein
MNISRLEQKIRDFINSGRRQYVLLENSSDWNKLCSSLDLIGDTELAIQAYPELCMSKGYGASYLIIYGILQTLLLQQDAAKHIANALNIKIKLPKELNDIRIVRNSAAGHPGLQKENGQSKSCFISRTSLTPIGFELMTTYSKDRDYKMTHVSIPELLKTQKSYLGGILLKVVEELERQEMEHRKAHKEIKLGECFPQTISYYFSKIFEATYGEDNYCLGKPHLGFIQDCLDDFKIKLEQRGEWNAHDSIKYHYDQLSYPMTELNTYFESKNESKLNDKDAYIFTSFLVEHLQTLEEIAIEIDERYAD